MFDEYGGFDLATYLASATPMNMPAGQRADAQSNFFGNYDAYSPNNSQNQYMDMLAQTQRFSGTPIYQLYDNYMPSMTPEIKQLYDKQQAYNAMSEADKMHARTTGNGYFNNADVGQLMNLTIGNQSIDFQDRADINRWTDQYNDQIATNILRQDNGNMPSNSKMWAADTLNNKTWASSTINDQTNVAPGTGNQFGRTIWSQAHNGVMPNERLAQLANDRDFWHDYFKPSGDWNAMFTGSGSKEGMAGAGSGMFAEYGSDTRQGDYAKEWGLKNGNQFSYKWGNGQPPGGMAPPSIQPYGGGPIEGGRSGITETGVDGRPTAANPNGRWNTSTPEKPGYGDPFFNPPQNDNGIPSYWPGTDKDWAPDGIDGYDERGNPIRDDQAARDNYYRMMQNEQKNQDYRQDPNAQRYYNPNTSDYFNQPEYQSSNYASGNPDLIASLTDGSGNQLGTHRAQFGQGGNPDASRVLRDDVFSDDYSQGKPKEKKYMPFPGRYQTGPIEAGQILARLLG